MRVVQCHNFYQQAGGEDRVLAEERSLLERYGHAVEQYVLHNDAVAGYTRLQLFGKTLWSREAHRGVRETVERFKPDVVHVHNTLPLLSPSVYYAARAAGAAVVQTLHNYRMVCPGAYCQRDGEPCELCVTKKFKWPAIRHACYRDSRSASATVTAMLALHGAAGTYRRAVDHYIVCSEFAREKMVSAGFASDHITTKPNFQLSDIGPGPGDGGYAMYLGRLSPEKGIETLLDAWDRDDVTIPLHISGGGPMEPQVRDLAARRANVTYLGRAPWEQVTEELHRAALLVFPSVTYEGHPMTLLEAMQAGTPVVGSRLGAIPEIVEEGVTGQCVPAHDADALADAVAAMFADPDRLRAMRSDVRRVYDQRYAADASHDRLMAIYERAIDRRHGPTRTHNQRHDSFAAPTERHDSNTTLAARIAAPALMGESSR